MPNSIPPITFRPNLVFQFVRTGFTGSSRIMAGTLIRELRDVQPGPEIGAETRHVRRRLGEQHVRVDFEIINVVQSREEMIERPDELGALHREPYVDARPDAEIRVLRITCLGTERDLRLGFFEPEGDRTHHGHDHPELFQKPILLPSQ